MSLSDVQRTVSLALVALALSLALVFIIRKLHKPDVEQKAVSNSSRRKSPTSGFNVYRIVPYAMLLLGLASLAASAFYSSYVLTLVGLGLIFWGSLLLYLTPTKCVKLELLNATASSNLANTEKILSSTETAGRGIYLPPRHLKDYQSCLVFIPRKASDPLPKREETDQEKLHMENPSQPKSSRRFSSNRLKA